MEAGASNTTAGGHRQGQLWSTGEAAEQLMRSAQSCDFALILGGIAQARFLVPPAVYEKYLLSVAKLFLNLLDKFPVFTNKIPN